MPTTANSITYFVAADGTLRDGQQGSIPQQPRINYGTEYAVTLSFPPDTLQEGDQLQVALNRTRTFFSSASATGDAPVAAVAKHEVTAEEAAAQAVTLTLSTNTRAMIDQVNGIDHPVRGFFGVHVLRGQSFVTLAVADALMLSLESGPDAISPSLPVVDYPTREEAAALAKRSENAADRAEEAAAGIVPPLQLSFPPTTSTVGSVGQLAVWHDGDNNKDHLYHLVFISTSESATLYHWEECVLVSQGNVAGGYAALDENGQLVSSVIPLANASRAGAISEINGTYGITFWSGKTQIARATNTEIDAKANMYYKPIVPANLEYAVRSVCKNITEIPAATSDYSLVDSSATTNNHSHVYSHSPSSIAPTYRLPQVTNTTISHYIELTVDFAAVQTYSFLDHAGEPIVPLFTPAIAAGDVYTFKMEYSAIKAAWLIYPQKQGAVADDFVMRGEVGAANGVAGLDGNALVPRNNLPKGGVAGLGAVRVNHNTEYGIYIDGNGAMSIQKATDANITQRTSVNKPLVPANLNYAVTSAITDANHITLTDAQKATAQSVFGVGGPITAIPAVTSAYTLAEGIFTHAPTSAPTYTLPNITDDIRTHEVVLIIDFSSVQTFSFLVDGGGDVTFQSYANPTMGDVWAFRCWWYGGKWRIVPTKIKNCVTRQLANGSLAITDAVAGNALALKMVAPRSVVVNQLIQNGDFSDGTTGWILQGCSATVSNNIITCLYNSSIEYFGIQRQDANLISGHVYLRHVSFRVNFNATTITISFNPTNTYNSPTPNTWIALDYKVTMSQDENKYRILATSASANTDTLELQNLMLVDLTQYFNGDTTLINSITSWDDLVAYDPRFASYVEYNTGAVTGVQPTVKVIGKNLFSGTVYTGGRNSSRPYINTTTVTSPYTSTSQTTGIGIKINVTPGKTYTLSSNVSSEMFNIGFYGQESDCNMYSRCMSHVETNTFTVPEGAHWIVVAWTYATNNLYTWSQIQLELGSVATSYEPYHDGCTAQAPAPLFAVGTAADEFEAVAGRTDKAFKQVDLSTLTWTAGEGTYSATIADIKPSTQNILLPNGYAGTVAGTTLTITASATPSGTAIYESATHDTSITTPATISLQAGNNTAMQTDGGRLAPIDITYESDEL